MKLLLGLLAGNLLLINYASAQKPVNEAMITYDISTESSTEATAKSLEGATLTVYIKGALSRTDMVSSLGTESNIYDSKAGKGTILKQYSGQKLMITLTAANWAEENRFYQSMKFTIDDTEQKIAGFTCKKATGKSSDGKTLVVYFAPGIVLANKQYDNSFLQLNGLPVQYELESGKLKFKYTLSNVSYEPVVASKFDIPKAGFRILTYEETQQLRKNN